MLSEKDLQKWLILWSAPKMFPNRFHRLLEIFDGLDAVFKAPISELKRLGLPDETIASIKKPNFSLIEAAMNWRSQPNCEIVCYGDQCYPSLLKETKGAPPLLFVKGNIECLSQLQIAVVGSRNPTLAGLEMATELSTSLSNAGFIITSGLASGIDAASHDAALAVGQKTIAVMGTGLSCIYPSKHQALAEKIAIQGALVSEFPLEMSPKRENFPKRNRIVSGLSLGVLVIEAGLKSGSLITARLAGEQGREVFAVPSSIRNPQARGCHYLIKNGAKLVEKTEDILEELGEMYYTSDANKLFESTPRIKLDPIENKLLECVGFELTSVDVIRDRCGFDITVVNQMLCKLQMKNLIDASLGGYIRVGK